jgi:hypothetical protein
MASPVLGRRFSGRYRLLTFCDRAALGNQLVHKRFAWFYVPLHKTPGSLDARIRLFFWDEFLSVGSEMDFHASQCRRASLRCQRSGGRGSDRFLGGILEDPPVCRGRG